MSPPSFLLPPLSSYIRAIYPSPARALQYSTVSRLITRVAKTPMEVKSAVAAVFFLLLLLSSPHFSTGNLNGSNDSGVYDIDYRGPETHSSSIPPPTHSRRRPWIHQRSTKPPPKVKNSKSANTNGRT
ncbi:hypothetical protein BT93_C1931 [Corymbia citriodora subsp. variegata]|nr:hypothetical protein BT93_C1931 [Corymbia citriodora subsp. variegata]